ncbi:MULTISPECIES: sensor histidine kinase [Nostocales]|uniref:histidine kinase n=3 Tax=Nostocales TaxID=1161 RepID=A0A8S9TDZ9_9CYAN|nr:sensor histidine kinase [Tolypothrix bouteillei]KAF3889862.1 sensor histidine kinase [Tolypothrix bouteillei VB521301]
MKKTRIATIQHLIQPKPHPFRLLLYLEWILLGIALLVEFPLVEVPHPTFLPPPSSSQDPLPLSLCIASFGIAGLWLPTARSLIVKILYTGFEFGLVFLAIVMSRRVVGLSPALLLILVVRSCLLFQLSGRLLVAGLAFLSFVFTWLLPLQNVSFLRAPLQAPLPRVPLPKVPPPPMAALMPKPMPDGDFRTLVWHLALNSGLMFGLVLVFVLLLVNALLAERQSREKLAKAHQKLREYALRIEDQATLQERNRIAREIHDSLGHSLTAQSIQLENAVVFLQSNLDKATTFLLEAKQLGSNALKEVRMSVATLRSDPLYGKSLESVLTVLLVDFQRRTGITPNCIFNLYQSLPAEVCTASYRIVQEALTNTAKHSGATHVTINIQVTVTLLSLEIYDNGKGFNPHQNTTGFGIQGMRERTLALGGQFYIDSKPGEGCCIKALLPY